MNDEAYDLLNRMPVNAPGDAGDLTELGMEDIPWDRVPKLQALLGGSDDSVALQAAMLLAHWGDDAGLDHLCALAFDSPPLTENRLPHRLQGHDDSYTNVLEALLGYWSKQADAGRGEEARKKLLKPVSRIINLSSASGWGLSTSSGWSNSMVSPNAAPASKFI